MRLPLPPGPVFRDLVLRTSLLWGAMRGVLLVLGVGFGRLAPAVVIVALIIALSVAWMRRREHLFLGNLGVPLPAAAAVNGLTAVALECAAASVAGLL